jgi:hypothetical protein
MEIAQEISLGQFLALNDFLYLFNSTGVSIKDLSGAIILGLSLSISFLSKRRKNES